MDNLPITSGTPLEPVDSQAVIAQVAAIQDLMRKVMKEGYDYGVIPGADKPTLLKAGAEKLAFYFRLSARYNIEVKDLPGGHKDVNCVCTIYSLRTQQVLGEGVGSCSTMETKYAYRWEDAGPVPEEYWRTHDKTILGDAVVRKKEGSWRLMRRVSTNPADYYNVVLKIAKKRAYVDAILTVTAASELFSQDLEDIVEVLNGEVAPSPDPHPAEDTTQQPSTDEPTPQQKKKLWAMLKDYGFSKEQASRFYQRYAEGLSKRAFSQLIDSLPTLVDAFRLENTQEE